MEFCKHYSKVAWTREHRDVRRSDSDGAVFHPVNSASFGSQSVLFTRLACGQWSCSYCARKMQKKWRAFLAERLPEISTDWQLLTLTSKGSVREQVSSYRLLQQGIDVFMKRIRRVHGEIDYVRTYEAQKKEGTLHAHFIITGFSPYVVPGCWRNLQPGYLAVLERRWRVGVWSLQTYLKNMAHECGMGYMADARPLPSYQAVNYVTKYLTKELQEINIKGLRHVQTTRRVGSPELESEYRWNVTDFVTARDFRAGETILDLQTNAKIDSEYWSVFDAYPPEMN